VSAIVVDPEIQGGVPCLRGTRVPVSSLVECLKGGAPLDEFLRQFPTVTKELAVEALALLSPDCSNDECAVISDPERMSGTPCFLGTRVPFKNLIDYFAHGRALDEFFEDFPTVGREVAIRALDEARY